MGNTHAEDGEVPTVSSSAINPLGSGQLMFLAKHQLAKGADLHISEGGKAVCASCGRALSWEGFNHTVIDSLPGKPFLCAGCIVKFVRAGVFVPYTQASDNPIPVLVDEDGDMHVDDVTITWEN